MTDAHPTPGGAPPGASTAAGPHERRRCAPADRDPPGRAAGRARPVRRRRPAGPLVALWASLLLVTYWWATGGGSRTSLGWADGLTSTGRLTGLIASDLLLVQVLLMARLPVLEHAFGQDRLARIHRLVGFTSFNLMLAHVVLITWGYAAGRARRHARRRCGTSP